MSKVAEVDSEAVSRTFLNLAEVGLEGVVVDVEAAAVGNVESCAFWVMGEAVSRRRHEAGMWPLFAACCCSSAENDHVCYRKWGASYSNRMLQLQLRRVGMRLLQPLGAPWRNLAGFASILDFSDVLPRPSREPLL